MATVETMASSQHSSSSSSSLAVKEVVSLLGKTTNDVLSSKDAFLEDLSALRKDVSAKSEKSTSVLNSLIQTITEEARSNIDLVNKVNKRSEALRGLFRDIEQLCEESSQLVNREHVTKLSRASYNINKTVQNTEDIIAIPSLALEAQQFIQEGQENEDEGGVDLVQGYVGITQLEGASLFARKAVVMQQGAAKGDSSENREGDSSDNHEDSRFQDTLSEYFDKVLDTSAKFETFLWSTIRNFIGLGRTNPDQLLSAVKVVEIQEHRDSHTVDDGAELKPKKKWKDKCFEEIEQAIENITLPLAKLCQMIGESVDTSRQTQTISIDEVLEVANSVAADFTDIYDYSAPCFPASYNIFNFMMKAYHKGFGKMIDEIGELAPLLSNRQVLSVITWITQYQGFIESLGIDISAESKEWDYCDLIEVKKESKVPRGGRRKSILSLDAFLRPEGGGAEEDKEAGAGERPEKPGVMGFNNLTQIFMSRMREYLTSWFANIIEAEEQQMSKPKEDDHGKLWTPALIDLFRILNQQVSIVQKATTGPMLLETSRTIIQVMIEFQGIEMERLGLKDRGEAALELAVAAVNTNLKAYEMSLDLADTIESSLDENCRGVVDIEEACRGFLQVSKLAVDQVVSCIIEDEGIVQMFSRSMFSPSWLTGGATSVLLATLEDYMQDVTRWIEKSFLKRVVESLITKVVDKWIEAFIAQTPIIQKDVTDQIVRDCLQLRDFFADYSRDSNHKAFQLMESFSDIVDAEDADSFVISYRLLLEVRDDFAPSNLEKVLSAREDINKKEAANVLSQCEEIFSSRKNLLSGHSIKAVSTAYRFFKHSKSNSKQKQ
ncbi:subunit Sec6 of exocyst complex [Chloropicon primus]|uniref:Subunit Sec6 of exocyst complex n=1 Tax=Chloropicon primus TaxID=1764295 RepID=A0A5B8MPI8_9CHLO|nr:subunit Sec6 of exocyst complex [Chloropicon primus]UPR00484.1 subunit Sec6 of exocyst complex [Chloropicon primus]|eukprot:QDZ21270.1 subunit Sec6 of exocyst complex [Chloropicon primus]